MIETLRALVFFPLLVIFYPLPVSLFLASVIRLVLRWGPRRFLALAAIAATPSSYVVLFMKTGLFGVELPGVAPAALIVATLFALACWVLAARRGGMGRFWLEPVVMVASTIWLLLAVPNWIAH